jgi:hypothetical protein
MMKGGETPTSVIPCSNRSGKGEGSPCLAAVNRVYMSFYTREKDKWKVLVNKGVSILKAEKKSNKQMIKEVPARRSR